MVEGLTAIVIPCFNHARYLREAIDSALAQTVPVHVVVVNDGSTDNTEEVTKLYTDVASHHAGRVSVLHCEHQGVARMRNIGIEFSREAEFLVFLDADDTIESTKAELQIATLTANAGWVLCDTRIVNVDGSVQLASERYDYAHKRLDGWLEPWLAVANFIPVHAPLIRREALGDIRFPTDRAPEDWHFWYELSRVARCRYTPAILATYQKHRGGRNSTTPKVLQSRPGAPSPLLLNLGCGNPDAASWHPMPRCVNLDRSLGWRFEDGLADFADGSVDGITISHAMMYVSLEDWPRVVNDFSRVLRPGGIIRITEDDTSNPRSSRFGGWRGSDPAIAMTDAKMVRHSLEAAGFTVQDVNAETTLYKDNSLVQAQHGAPPDVFFIEGVRECSVFLSPHADDEALFGSFSIIRHRPHVVVCFPSTGDYGDTDVRSAESRAAVEVLGGHGVDQWDGRDLVNQMRELDQRMRPTLVFAPDVDASHPEHRAVTAAAVEVFGNRIRWFHTYNDRGKVRDGNPVAFEPGWPEIKRKALACYRTQIAHPRAKAFFAADLAEYAP